MQTMITLTMECHLIFLVTLIAICEGSGHISLTMVRYYNPGGRGRNGHPCDGKFFFSGSDCDHRFTICLDQSNGPNNVYRCPYGRKSTGEVSNNNNNYFGGNVGGVANPMIFPFAFWPGGLKIKVEVWDVDDNGDDYVDFLAATYRTIPGFNVTSASLVPYTLSSRTTLWLKLKVYCDQDYYGETCAAFCQSRDDRFGHYTCDPNSGSKICLKGWQGTLCHVQIDNCLSSPCLNSATCINSHGGFLCVCADGFNGTFCEDKNDCYSNPCQNGGTCSISEEEGYTCQCMEGLVGPTCSLQILPDCSGITVKEDWGKVDQTDFMKNLKNLLSERYKVQQSDIYILVNNTVEQRENNLSDTLLTARVFIKSRAVCLGELQPLLTEMNSLVPGSQPLSNEIIHSKSSQSWLSLNWYIVVIAVVSAILILSILFFVLKKRKQQKHVINGSRRYNNDSDVAHLDEANGFIPITFENSLYATVQPEEPIRVSTRYDFDDS